MLLQPPLKLPTDAILSMYTRLLRISSCSTPAMSLQPANLFGDDVHAKSGQGRLALAKKQIHSSSRHCRQLTASIG